MGKGKKRIKSPEVNMHAGRVGLSNFQYANSGDTGTPIFCFKHVHRNYNLGKCCDESNPRYVKGLLKKLEVISQNTWEQIQLAHRKGSGTEKITRDSIGVGVPATISPDVRDFLSFYFSGDKGRLIGYRGEDTVFHVVYIDTKLSVYSH